jgi:hypothetical protein
VRLVTVPPNALKIISLGILGCKRHVDDTGSIYRNAEAFPRAATTATRIQCAIRRAIRAVLRSKDAVQCSNGTQS